MFESDWNNTPNVKPKSNPYLVWSAGCTVDEPSKVSVPSEVHHYGTFYTTLKQMIRSANQCIDIWAEQFVYKYYLLTFCTSCIGF